MRRVGLTILLCLCYAAVDAQTITEEFAELFLSSEAYSGVSEVELEALITELLDRPLKINNANREELERLPFLSQFQVESILNYRELYGDILSPKELSLLPGFQERFVNKIAGLFSFKDTRIDNRRSLRELLGEGRWQIIGRGRTVIERMLGNSPVGKEEFKKRPDCRYLSFPGTFYGQIKFNSGDRLSSCITIERDSGEPGIDYISGNIQFKPSSVIENVIIGDYSARFGQGLVLWNALTLDGSIDPRSLKRMGNTVLPYNSTDENLSLRGIASQFCFGDFNLSVMGSYKNIDANIKSGGFSSMLKTGLHNTVSTNRNKHSLTNWMTAINGSYTFGNLRIGTTAAVYSFSLPYNGKNSEMLIRFPRSNTIAWNVGFDSYFVYRRIRFFSEVALDSKMRPAAIAGMLFSVNDRMDAGFQYKYYPDNYYSYYAMSGLKNGSSKGAHRLALISRSYFGRSGSLSSRLEWMPQGRSYKASLRLEYDMGSYRYYIRVNGSNRTGSIAINMGYNLNRRFNLYTRADLSFANNGEAFYLGHHIFQEALYSSSSYKFKAAVRVAWFNTPVWDCAIYAYERDILYGFSIPALYGKGMRYYLNLRWDVTRSLSLWLKMSQTRYFDRDEIGSSLDKILSSHKSEVKFEFRVRF